MKNLILTVFFFFYTFSSFAQEVLDMSILPEAAYTYIVRNDTASTYAITPASTSPQTWDFSSLLNHYEKVPTYDSTSKSPYQAEFPSSNLYTYGPSVLYSGLFGGAPVDGQPSNGYMFWRNEPTGFWSIGFLSETGTFAGQSIHFDSDELIIPLPGILNSTINNNSRWTIPMDFNPADADTFYVSNTTKTFNFDSYGSIKTPVLDLPEVLRLHENHLK